MARVLYCSRCQATYFNGSRDIPAICQICGRETVWKTVAPVSDEPRPAWELSYNDRQFLHSIKVRPEA